MKYFLMTLGVMLATLVATQSVQADSIDFEGIAEGTIVTEVTSVGGEGPISVEGRNPDFGEADAAMIFDSACDGGCSGQDPDLGTPNEDFGGPGIGDGGSAGMPNQNDTEQGNILIISEDLDSGDPDDVDVNGANVSFDFSALGTVTLESMLLIDVEGNETGAIVGLFSPENVLLDMVNLPPTGNNGTTTVGLGPTSGVSHMEVVLNGSGAIDDIVFTVDEFCGNDRQEGGEICDGKDADACPDECTEACACPECGDGNVDNGEQCDDGNDDDTDECRNNCTEPACGDGILDKDEECDDGNTDDGDGCSANCTYEPACGDGNTDDGEECDDGNNDDGDGCSADCANEPECGDGNTDDGEECDDGNNDDGDGCSANCEVEERGDQGCTPGYWKQPHHEDSWQGVDPGDSFNATFMTDLVFSATRCGSSNPTLAQALRCRGGGRNALARQATAAYLNALNDSVGYAYSADQVKAMVKEAADAGSKDAMTAAKSKLGAANEAGCPLN